MFSFFAFWRRMVYDVTCTFLQFPSHPSRQKIQITAGSCQYKDCLCSRKEDAGVAENRPWRLAAFYLCVSLNETSTPLSHSSSSKTLETLGEEPEVLGPGLAASQLDDLERATSVLWATVSSSVK